MTYCGLEAFNQRSKIALLTLSMTMMDESVSRYPLNEDLAYALTRPGFRWLSPVVETHSLWILWESESECLRASFRESTEAQLHSVESRRVQGYPVRSRGRLLSC